MPDVRYAVHENDPDEEQKDERRDRPSSTVSHADPDNTEEGTYRVKHVDRWHFVRVWHIGLENAGPPSPRLIDNFRPDEDCDDDRDEDSDEKDRPSCFHDNSPVEQRFVLYITNLHLAMSA